MKIGPASLDTPRYLVALAIIVTSVASLLAVQFEPILLLIVAAMPISVVLAAAGTVYLARIYKDRGYEARSWVWEAIIVVCAIVVIVGVGIGFLAALRVADALDLIHFVIPSRVTSPFVAVAIIALLSAPTYYAARIAWVRRTRGNHTPPPLGDRD